MGRDAALDTLLELDGIRYNLTLHDPGNRRIFAFDNVHAPKVKKGKGSGRFKGRIVEYDHAHYG